MNGRNVWGCCMAGMAAGLMFAGRAWAADEPKGDKPRQGLRAEIRDEMTEYVDDQRNETQEFRKSLEGLTPAQQCAAIRKHRMEQHAENVAFAEKEYQKVVENIKQRMTERGMPVKRQEKMLTSLATRHAKRTALAEKQFNERMALLETLSGKPDLTAEEMKTELKALLEKQRVEREALRDSLGAEGRGERPGDGPRPRPQSDRT